MLAIFGGGLTKVCFENVKPGGLVLRNNHHNDGENMKDDPSIELVAIFKKQEDGKNYFVEDIEADTLEEHFKGHQMPNKYLKSAGEDMVYIDKEMYMSCEKLSK